MAAGEEEAWLNISGDDAYDYGQHMEMKPPKPSQDDQKVHLCSQPITDGSDKRTHVNK